MTTTTELFANMKMIRLQAYEVAACAAQTKLQQFDKAVQNKKFFTITKWSEE